MLFCKKYNIKRLREYSNMAKKDKMSLISLQTPTCRNILERFSGEIYEDGNTSTDVGRNFR